MAISEEGDELLTSFKKMYTSRSVNVHQYNISTMTIGTRHCTSASKKVRTSGILSRL